ncbi:MAG: hypothetical protein ABRQ37_15610 [Candidatus Eremiobacterota bacterium]
MRNQFTIEEIIKITGKSKSTIYRDIKRGRLKVKQGEKRGKPVYLITNKEIEAYSGKLMGNQWETSETPIGNQWEFNEKTVGNQNNVITRETLVKAIEEIFSQQETRLIKPLEDQAMFLAGKLTNENQFLKQRLETVLEENRQLREQIKALPGPAESIQQVLMENAQNLTMLQKEKEELLNRVEEKTKELENYIPLSTQLESTSQKLQEKENEMKSLEAKLKQEKDDLELRLLQEKEKALKEQEAKALQDNTELKARLKAENEEAQRKQEELQTKLKQEEKQKIELEAKLKAEEEEKVMAKAATEEALKQLKELPAPVESIQQILLDNANNIKELAKEKDNFQAVLKKHEATIKEKERALKDIEELRRQELEQLKKQAEEEKAKLKAEAEEEKKQIAEAWKKEVELAKKPWWKFW